MTEDDGRVIRLTGTKELTARVPFDIPADFKPAAMIHLSTCAKPDLTNRALWRRLDLGKPLP